MKDLQRGLRIKPVWMGRQRTVKSERVEHQILVLRQRLRKAHAHKGEEG